MANATWPTTLPQYLTQSGYGEDWTDQNLRAASEGGALKTRRRFTAAFNQVKARIICSADQVVLFENFYRFTLKGGSLYFDWVHPRSRVATTMQIIGKVQVTPTDGDNFAVSFTLEMKP